MENSIPKKLKSLEWHDNYSGSDGVVRYSSGVDEISVCGTKIYALYDIDAGALRGNGTNDRVFHILVRFPNKNYIQETVYSLEEGKKRCEELREEFWNKLYNAIEEMFVSGE